MSSDADASAAQIVALFESLYSDNYCNVAASVLFIYETCLTLDREVAYLWSAKRTGASLLFFANKWISMTVYVMMLAEFASFPSDKRSVYNIAACSYCRITTVVRSCSNFQVALFAVGVLQFIPWAIFSALRGYVVAQSKFLGLLILTLSLAPVGANLVQYGYQLSGENIAPFGCLETNTATVALELKYCVLRAWGIGTSILLILNVLHLVLSATASAGAGNGEQSFVTVFTTPITAILVSRFLQELQEADQMVVRLDPDDPLHFSRNPYDDTPSFISSLGAFINPDVPPREDDTASDVDTHSDDSAVEEGGIPSPAVEAHAAVTSSSSSSA
ncbi:hypothetical protein OH76DRAFT_1489388 [Lentinus brumalis]|uniref:DUF6533 domain-containing protein n=1 Tax=Lentinus brumalis TaxID=2498619 RepID=A0A371CMQ4_9APHY|nr:hypothetical protein OH76DRAFT_1489388 [Polyporus brumalis]